MPVSSHLFIEASAHVLPVTPLAHYLEYMDLAGPVIVEPPVLAEGCVTPRGPGLGMDRDEAAVERYRFYSGVRGRAGGGAISPVERRGLARLQSTAASASGNSGAGAPSRSSSRR